MSDHSRLVTELDNQLACCLERPKGIIVNNAMFSELYNSGRLSLTRGVPDFWIQLLGFE